MSKPKTQKTPRQVSNPCSAVEAVAREIARIQCRQKAIDKRQEVIETESDRLTAEGGRIEVRRLELLREFDKAAQ